VYTAFFKISSVFTPFFLGITLGAVILGRITLEPGGFYRVFIYPWFNVFSFSLGFFVVVLFTFLSTLYLLGEAKNSEDINTFKRYSRWAVMVLVVSGLLVFLAAEIDKFHLFNSFISSPVSVISMLSATLLLPVLWIAVNKHHVLWIRLIAGAQTFFVMLGWFAIQYPVLVKLSAAPDITIANAQAPESTMFQLMMALIVGIILVIPALLYLFKVFKFGKPEPDY
jgi:cytochrome d ubiquinol oxidase subunit II